jgi:hypothetical protein
MLALGRGRAGKVSSPANFPGWAKPWHRSTWSCACLMPRVSGRLTQTASLLRVSEKWNWNLVLVRCSGWHLTNANTGTASYFPPGPSPRDPSNAGEWQEIFSRRADVVQTRAK